MGLVRGILYESISLHRSQNKKLKKLIEYAVRNSDLYAEKYKDIDIDEVNIKELGRLPIITKKDLTDNYEKWVTESITAEEVDKHAEDGQKILDGKYVVASTSGTTGDKLMVASTIKEFERMMAAGIINTWPKKSYMLDILFSNRPVVYILPTNGLYASYMIADSYLGISKNKKSKIIDISENIDSMINQLNWINPILIGGYVSTFKMLAEYAKDGKLNINVKYMVPVGSRYGDDDRELMTSAFGCKTFTSYSCTECGEIGHECEYGHFHISTDVIVEPIDRELRPVSDEVESDSILITNLWNYTSPFIRYKLNDKCIVHSSKCKCGCKEKWIEVIGRKLETADTLHFTDNKGNDVKILGAALELVLAETCGHKENNQLLIKGNLIEVVLTNMNDIERHMKFKEIQKEIRDQLSRSNIEATIVPSKHNLFVVENSGKVKKIKVI